MFKMQLMQLIGFDISSTRDYLMGLTNFLCTGNINTTYVNKTLQNNSTSNCSFKINRKANKYFQLVIKVIPFTNDHLNHFTEVELIRWCVFVDHKECFQVSIETHNLVFVEKRKFPL